MKLALRLPHSRDMTLTANAMSLCGQTVILNTFTVIGTVEENTTNLQMRFYSDIEVIFTIEIVKNSLKIKVICPQLQKETKFIAYENGSHANIEIVNLNTISLANTTKLKLLDSLLQEDPDQFRLLGCSFISDSFKHQELMIGIPV